MKHRCYHRLPLTGLNDISRWYECYLKRIHCFQQWWQRLIKISSKWKPSLKNLNFGWLWHTWYLSQCHKWDMWIKSVKWRNFRFLYMTDVETSEIYPHAIWRYVRFPNYFTCEEISNFSTHNTIICNLRYFVANLFCCDLLAFVWRKLSPKLNMWRKKTNIRYGLRWLFSLFCRKIG